MPKALVSACVDIQVPFHDVDAMEVVWHGHYCKYFEIARCALLDSIDYNYRQMRESGYAWPMIELRLRYVKPARFGQTIRVEAGLVEWENRLKIEYLICDRQQTRLTRGYSVQVAVDMRTETMCYQSPAVLYDKLGLAKP